MSYFRNTNEKSEDSSKHDQLEEVYNFEDSYTDEDCQDEKNDVDVKTESGSDYSSDNCDEEEREEDPDVDFVMNDANENPILITAQIISTEIHDGLVYTELENETVIITSAKYKMKKNGTLTYQEGTGVTFKKASTGDDSPRTFVACPKICW